VANGCYGNFMYNIGRVLEVESGCFVINDLIKHIPTYSRKIKTLYLLCHRKNFQGQGQINLNFTQIQLMKMICYFLMLRITERYEIILISIKFLH
jgi:hypothetical protein